jgi:hypothetical protein
MEFSKIGFQQLPKNTKQWRTKCAIMKAFSGSFPQGIHLESGMPSTIRKTNFNNGAVVSPNQRSQTIHPTRRLGEANQITSRRIKNATNRIKQHRSRIS